MLGAAAVGAGCSKWPRMAPDVSVKSIKVKNSPGTIIIIGDSIRVDSIK